MTEPNIEFQAQHGSEYCGAAALSMIYQSCGITETQESIWKRVAEPGRGGRMVARSRRLALDAIAHGLPAMVLRANDPIGTLKYCEERGIRVILNHRISTQSELGHFTVLFGTDRDHVIIHDPQFGGKRRISNDELLDLWQPIGDSEITGNILVTVMPPAAFPKDRPLWEITCPSPAQTAIPLEPGELLHAKSADGYQPLIECLFCPDCDLELHAPTMADIPTGDMAGAGQAAAGGAAAGGASIPKMDAPSRETTQLEDEEFLANWEPPEIELPDFDEFPAAFEQVMDAFRMAIKDAPTNDYRVSMTQLVEILEKEGPGFAANAKREIQESLSQIKEYSREIAASSAKVREVTAQMEAAAAAAPDLSEVVKAPPPPKVDPDLGGVLRKRFLDRLGKTGAPVVPEVVSEAETVQWEDWFSRSQSSLQPGKAPTPQGAASSMGLSPAASSLQGQNLPPLQYVQRLCDQNLTADAISYTANWLPPREAVWWSVLSVIHCFRQLGLNLGEDQMARLENAAEWVQNPTQWKLRSPLPASLTKPGDLLVAAIVGPIANKAAIGGRSAPTLLASAVLTAANWGNTPRGPMMQKGAVQLGIDVAEGKRLWATANTPPAQAPAPSDSVKDNFEDWINDSLRH